MAISARARLDTIGGVAERRVSRRGFDPGASIDRELASEQISVRGLVLRFTAAGLIALVVAAVVTAYSSRSVGTSLAINDARLTTWVTAKGLVSPVLTDDLLQLDASSLETVDRAVRSGVLSGSLVRVKIWDRTGRIIYSDEPRLIGLRFELEPDEAAMFDDPTHRAVADVTDLDKPENRFETENKLLQVYLPVATREGTPLLYEAYFRYRAVTEVGQDLWRRFAPVAVGALLALELVQIPFAWRLARRLRRGQVHRERLLRHAIESSETERRRIAGDLHDGVVQDLTGVSLSLAAAAKGPNGADPRLVEAASAIRESVKSLRSLLVEIYPPNLYDEGLETALGDLLAGLTNRGIATTLDVRLDQLALDPSTTGLCYRIAQEALRNVVTHASARRVDVAIEAVGPQVQLTVADDGRGFDSGMLEGQQRDGHFGLRSLGELARDAGGSLTVHSSAGSGTLVTLRVPVAQGRAKS